MDVLKAHALMGALDPAQRPELPVVVESPDVDAWPASAVALALLSGQLEEAQTGADLLEAVEQGAMLVSAGVVEEESLLEETRAVMARVLEWGTGALN